jgi:hypothetical protein
MRPKWAVFSPLRENLLVLQDLQLVVTCPPYPGVGARSHPGAGHLDWHPSVEFSRLRPWTEPGTYGRIADGGQRGTEPRTAYVLVSAMDLGKAAIPLRPNEPTQVPSALIDHKLSHKSLLSVAYCGRLRAVTSGPSLQRPDNPPESDVAAGRPKRTVDAGVATVVAAIILAIGGVAGGFISHAIAPTSKTASSRKPAVRGLAEVTITPPRTGDVKFESTMSGKVVNLQAGQLVWTFTQGVNRDGSFRPETYPSSGPCDVNYTSHRWVCHHVYVGIKKDRETYRVCAAILSLRQAFTVVQVLENTLSKSSSQAFWFASPPAYLHDSDDSSCMTVHRVN